MFLGTISSNQYPDDEDSDLNPPTHQQVQVFLMMECLTPVPRSMTASKRGQELPSVTMLCCLLDQEIGPQLLMNRKPEVDQELSGSWDHPASVYPWKSKSIESSFLSNLNSMSFVAWMYISTHFAASQYANLGLALKQLSVLTA